MADEDAFPVGPPHGAAERARRVHSLQAELQRLEGAWKAQQAAAAQLLENEESRLARALTREADSHSDCANVVSQLMSAQVATQLIEFDAEAAILDDRDNMVEKHAKLTREVDEAEAEAARYQKRLHALEQELHVKQESLSQATRQFDQVLHNVSRLKASVMVKEERDRVAVSDQESRQAAAARSVVAIAAFREQTVVEELSAIETELKATLGARLEVAKREARTAHGATQRQRDTEVELKAREIATEVASQIVTDYQARVLPVSEQFERQRVAYGGLADSLAGARDRLVRLLCFIREGEDTGEDVARIVAESSHTALASGGEFLSVDELLTGLSAEESAHTRSSVPVGGVYSSVGGAPSLARRARSIEPRRPGGDSSLSSGPTRTHTTNTTTTTPQLRSSSLDPIVQRLRAFAKGAQEAKAAPRTPLPRDPTLVNVDAVLEGKDAGSLGIPVAQARYEMVNLMEKVMATWKKQVGFDSTDACNFLRDSHRVAATLPRPPIAPSSTVKSGETGSESSSSHGASDPPCVDDVTREYRLATEKLQLEGEIRGAEGRLRALLAEQQRAVDGARTIRAQDAYDSERALAAELQAATTTPLIAELRSWLIQAVNAYHLNFGDSALISDISALVLGSASTAAGAGDVSGSTTPGGIRIRMSPTLKPATPRSRSVEAFRPGGGGEGQLPPSVMLGMQEAETAVGANLSASPRTRFQKSRGMTVDEMMRAASRK